MKNPKPTPAEVEKTIEKFLEGLHAQTLDNYSRIKKNGLCAFAALSVDEGRDDEMYEDYNTDGPSPVDEEPVHESDEELYLLYRHTVHRWLN